MPVSQVSDQGLAGANRTALAAQAQAGASRLPEDAAEQKKENFLSRLLRPLRDFGFGRASIWEGGVGLFILAAIGVALVLISWARGGQLFGKGGGYQAIMEFPLACGIAAGTPVRIRGVAVGSVAEVQSSLERVTVTADIKEPSTVIPRNSLIEANQSGLIAEPLIDITPQLPIPTYTAGPMDSECEKEGKIVCHQGHIKGQPGVAMDDLVYICTKIARQMDMNGLDRMFEAADAATAAIEEARPLLTKAENLANEITPLLSELREGHLVGQLEALTRSASEAAQDIHRLQHEVLTEDNVRALRDAVMTLTRTLEHIESISGDVGGITGDGKVKTNVKQLIEALSRIVYE
ncbi:hypothetical protein WJX84_012121 [Apatococcus fuscideae]|uniref:Mce/MlaD domain-containing protein n=1 Tax=Apatococcus fuscideae TaxID=2026836 RepID=A0AAW1SWU8_9CHLO